MSDADKPFGLACNEGLGPTPPLPRKKPAVFHHPMGFELYDALAMDLHAMTYAEPLLAEIARLTAARVVGIRQEQIIMDQEREIARLKRHAVVLACTAARAERERCAALCESTYPELRNGELVHLPCFDGGEDCARAIRSLAA